MTDRQGDVFADGLEQLRVQTQRQQRELFAQLEALLWLRDLLQLERPLPPTRGWAASPDLLLAMAQHIVDRGPQTVVELGSGTSSIVLGAALRRAGGGRLISLEHEPEHAARTRANLSAHGLDELAQVVDAPLNDITVKGRPWRWYGVPMERMPDSIDILFVDGPPAATWDLARYPALPTFIDRMSPGSAVFVDDGVRNDERRMVELWAQEYPDFKAEKIPSEKEAFALYRGS